MRQAPDKQYWFKAKRYGWGWGLPSSWQGWAFFIPWLLIVAGATLKLMPQRPLAFAAMLLAMTLLLVGVCVIKGEPPGWRWGDPK